MRRMPMGVALLAFAACAAPTPNVADESQSPASRVELGRPFDLRIGDEVEIGTSGTRVRFTAVRGDSRCPAAVQCPWAGDAEIVLRVTDGGASSEIVLHTDLEPRAEVVGPHSIRLETLRPRPEAGTEIPTSAYVATVVATPR